MIGFIENDWVSKGVGFYGRKCGILLTIDLIFIILLYEKWDGYYCGRFFGCV